MGIRSFIALPLPEEVVGHLVRLHESVPHEAGKIRWVKEDAIHLTCVFLGDIEPVQVEPIEKALREMAAGVEPFVTSLDGVGAFPNFNRPRVIWVGYADGGQEAEGLKGRVDEALVPLGFEPEKRRFHPHVTLGRVKAPGKRGILERAASNWIIPYENWMTRELILFQSVLDRHGPTYFRLATVPLGSVE